MSARRVVLDGETLSLEELALVAAGGADVEVSTGARAAVERSRAMVERIAEGDVPVYGINTGFGKLAEVRIARADLAQLQKNLVLSHAAGVGEPLSQPEARAMMVLRANVFCKGLSGVRPALLDLLVELLNRGITPIIPEKGSVGASGDLAPLAHLALVLIGAGEATFEGARISGAEALARAGLVPITLAAKEGLALVNGTQAMVAVGTLALLRAESLARTADVCGAMTLEGLLGSQRPFAQAVQDARPHPGQAQVAKNLRALLDESAINKSHQEFCDKVQDPYSLRCMPQVHGAARDALAFARATLSREVNAGTDNPLVFAESGEVVSCGNFHGQPVAQALDLLAIGVSQLATISERRVEQLVNPTLSGLPPFLARNSGLNSGFMLAQVTAAALVAENRILCHPACVDSIPSSAGREDHVSMGMTAALKARQVVENVRTVLAIEAMVAAQGLDFRAPLLAGKGAAAAWRALRRVVPTLEDDRELHKDITAVCRLIDLGALEDAAAGAVGMIG